MDCMKAFMDQHMIAMIGEIVLFANTCDDGYAYTMAWKYVHGHGVKGF